jgi:ankyrin repeat protein
MQVPTNDNNDNNDVETTPLVKLCNLLDNCSNDNEVEEMLNVEEMLKEHPEVINQGLDYNGWTPLMFAVNNCSPIIVKKILDYGAIIDQRNYFGSTALMIACMMFNHNCISILLNYNADVKLYDHAGNTALMTACMTEEFSTHNLKRLLGCGADVNYQNHINGKSAFIIACRNRNTKIVNQMFKRRNVDLKVSYLNSRGFGDVRVTVLQDICRDKEYIPIIRILLEHGAIVTEDHIDDNFDIRIIELLKSQLIKQLKKELQLQKDTFQQDLKDQFEELKIQLMEELYAPGEIGESSAKKHFEEIGKRFSI